MLDPDLVNLRPENLENRMDISSLKQQFDASWLAAGERSRPARAARSLPGAQERPGFDAAEGRRGGAGRRASGARPGRQPAQTAHRRRADRAPGRRRRRAARPATPSTSRCRGGAPLVGHRHPLTLLRERIESIFLRMGFLIVEGPELEDDYHNFEALNMPAEHPARDMQDTLYLASPVPRARRRPSPRRCCARTPPACRSATWRRTSRRSG